jgi:hypothetical protein
VKNVEQVQLGNKSIERLWRECLGEEVSQLRLSRYRQKLEDPLLNSISDKVAINL